LRLWRPGVKLGVRPGSWSHHTEWFGPVLGVMRAADLDEAIDWQNQVAFGLTGGLWSLDPAGLERWLARVELGHAYGNRPLTGAVVRRQPFGGWKRSSVGPGAKAGGPSYVAQLVAWHDDGSSGPDVEPSRPVARTVAAAARHLDIDDAAWLHAAAASDEDLW